MDPDLAAVITSQAERQNADQALRGAGYEDNGLVFCHQDGTPYNPYAVSRAFERARVSAKLSRIVLHNLRYTWATLALLSDIHTEVVQERLGHADVAITLRGYSHVVPVIHEEAAATVRS
jgi:integrase